VCAGRTRGGVIGAGPATGEPRDSEQAARCGGRFAGAAFEVITESGQYGGHKGKSENDHFPSA
jgi:hypothetical protein